MRMKDEITHSKVMELIDLEDHFPTMDGKPPSPDISWLQAIFTNRSQINYLALGHKAMAVILPLK